MKLIIVPIGATLGVISIFNESVDVTSKLLSAVATFPYTLATVTEIVWFPSSVVLTLFNATRY